MKKIIEKNCELLILALKNRKNPRIINLISIIPVLPPVVKS